MKLFLQGLSCANCASKIENAINNLQNIKSSHINFAAGNMTIELYDNLQAEDTLKKIQNIMDEIEPGVKVSTSASYLAASDFRAKDYLSSQKKAIFTILASGALFLTGLIFKFPLPVEFAIYLTAYLIAGHNILFKAVKNIFSGQVFDENFLMSLATIAAFSLGQFSEGAAVMLLYKIGEFLQETAVTRSQKSISALLKIRPDYANLKQGEEIIEVAPEEISPGDVIVVKPGEKIPLDGIIIAGDSFVDASALTGEWLPKAVKPSDEVLSGSINTTGLLTIKATKSFGQSTVAKILDLVQNAAGRKAKTENFITKFARIYTPLVVALAFAIALIPPIFMKEAVFSDWIYRSLVFLIISCPCALVISIPLGFFGGIGASSKHGVLVKGANYLEALSDVDIVVFDKTGTLTKGVFKVKEILSKNGMDKDLLLEYAAYAESCSSHPIAASIINEYGKNIEQNKIIDYTEIPGYGVKTKIKLAGKENQVLIGNKKLLAGEKISLEGTEPAGTIAHMAIDGEFAASFVISDIVKEDAAGTVQGLKKMGIRKTVMLSGDRTEEAGKIAGELMLDGFYAELLPHEKVEKLEEIGCEIQKNKKLAFVGDGINDAPVLARADIGIAMGGVGSDAAVEAADVIIMTDEPSKIVTAIKIAKVTRKIIWQNISLAIGIKILAMTLGAAGIATIWEAVVADVGVTLLAVLNAMRILNMGLTEDISYESKI